MLVSDESVRHICKSCERVILGAFTTKNTVPAGLLFSLCWLIYKLPEGALERLLTKLIEATWFCVLGWVLLFLTIIIGWKLFRWREQLHLAELAQVTKVRDRLVEEQLKLKLDPPPLQLEAPQSK